MSNGDGAGDGAGAPGVTGGSGDGGSGRAAAAATGGGATGGDATAGDGGGGGSGRRGRDNGGATPAGALPAGARLCSDDMSLLLVALMDDGPTLCGAGAARTPPRGAAVACAPPWSPRQPLPPL